MGKRIQAAKMLMEYHANSNYQKIRSFKQDPLSMWLMASKIKILHLSTFLVQYYHTDYWPIIPDPLT